MKRLIVYHNADWDGMFSAAIVHLQYPDAELYGYNRGPVTVDLDKYDEIYVVDIDLPEESMRKYADKIIWIDHHLTSYYRFMDVEFKDILVDVSGKVSAAYLTWEYFYKDSPRPICIDYVSEYDVHNFTDSKEDVMRFQAYLRTCTLSVGAALHVITSCDSTRFSAFPFLEIGSGVIDLKRQEEKCMIKNNAWAVTLGNHIGIAVLTSNMSSLDVENTINDPYYSFVMMLNRNDDETFKVSIRVGEHSDFNAREWCEKHNGGGHDKAAGCLISVDEFIRLYTLYTI